MIVKYINEIYFDKDISYLYEKYVWGIPAQIGLAVTFTIFHFFPRYML